MLSVFFSCRLSLAGDHAGGILAASDESKSKVLLDPELNPIMNPLLATHMGRWAEVYFTTPPERREQAVAELLRELARDAASPHAGSHSPQSANAGPMPPRAEWDSPASGQAKVPRSLAAPASDQEWFASKLQAPILQRAEIEKADAERALSGTVDSGKARIERVSAPWDGEQPDREPPVEGKSGLRTRGFEPPEGFREENHFSSSPPANPADFADTDSQVAVCERCGHLNLGALRFCGMCGSTLIIHAASQKSEPLPETPHQDSSLRWEEAAESIPEFSGRATHSDGALEVRPDADADPWAATNSPRRDFEPQAEEREEERKEREGELNLPPSEVPALSSFTTEPTSRHYRLYVGLIVLTFLGVLVYVTWRDNSGKTTVSSALPSAVTDSSIAPAPSPKPKSTPATSTQSALKQEAVKQSVLAQSAATKVSTGQTNLPPANHGTKAPASSKPLATAGAEPSSAAANPSGAEELAAAQKYLQAGPEGASQAVPLLWKAVAKENAAAALLLSDLYLRGDGVGKSCDQAKLLLHAAARQAGAAAADRLQRLHDYGCQ